MQHHKVVYSKSADDDLAGLFLWIYEASLDPYQAERLVQRIRKSCDVLVDFPHMGRARDDLVLGLRTIAFERRAVIAYIVEKESILITNVFYNGRDFEAMYRDDDLESFDR